MDTISFFRLYRKQLLAYSFVVIAAWLASCGKSNGYGGGTTPPPTTYTLSASLNGGQETPPNAATGTGTLSGTYDPSTYKITYSLSWTGITGAATGMHFHEPALAGSSAPVVIGITGFSSATYGSVSGSAVATQAQGADLLAGKWYVNIHTSAYPNGEIRGQIMATK
ncbi:CHRD domain-containing protein [Chitinophaga niastensis]|uniref:CHRD domain-containing protein n=1 Tax=Chitinophaga niastensis TaxID=536980 RepID=A0A2P8H9I4_CHINA|nr:CHRD domain-containing protein [Chitinophaga niastensis]PSL42885.1 CHRD domain-containing protein [Chitinophaga niastensis]